MKKITIVCDNKTAAVIASLVVAEAHHHFTIEDYAEEEGAHSQPKKRGRGGNRRFHPKLMQNILYEKFKDFNRPGHTFTREQAEDVAVLEGFNVKSPGILLMRLEKAGYIKSVSRGVYYWAKVLPLRVSIDPRHLGGTKL